MHRCAAGDAVKTDDIIAQIETDKVTIDIRAPHDGVIQSLSVSTLVPSLAHRFRAAAALARVA